MTKAEVIASMDEMVEALAAYSARTDRDVELILRLDGTATVMGADGPDAFEQIAEFDGLADLAVFLAFAPAVVS